VSRPRGRSHGLSSVLRSPQCARFRLFILTVLGFGAFVAHLGWDVWRCSVGIDRPDFRRIFIEEDLAPVSEAQARDLVATAIAACMKDLQDVAVPYLAEWLRFRGPDGAVEQADGADEPRL
jgi:hypothetical protein